MPAGYFRGFTLEANTNNTAMALRIRDADTNTVRAFSGPAGNSTIQHAIQSQIEYSFPNPFVAHLCRYEPGNDANNNAVSWQFFGIKWIFDPWPEFSQERSAFFDLGTPRAKYVRGGVLPIDSGGNNVSFLIPYDDGNSNVTIGPFNTPANIKTPTPFSFQPFVAHEFQLIPSAMCRTWWEEIQWDQEVWPERIIEFTNWMNLGTPGAKYMRGVVLPVETGGVEVTFTLVSSDGSAVTMGKAKTLANFKTPVPFAFAIPLIGHEYQIWVDKPCRMWPEEARWDFDPWPELITEATGWLPVLPGNAAAFLQGLLLPVEAAGADISLSLITDADTSTIALIPSRVPLANRKTPIAYALATPVVCHQVQIVPSAACRVWLNEIQWIAEATPEVGTTWTTQATSHGMQGYHSVLRIEAAYSSIAAVSLRLTAFDGTSPALLTLPSTGGAKQRILLTPTMNKGMLYTYSATSPSAFQLFGKETTIEVAGWGRRGAATKYHLLGGAFDDRAAI